MRIRNLFLGIVLAAVLLLAGIYIVSCLSIGAGVREIAEEAVRIHQGAPVDALILFMESGDEPWAKRNRAVWALGQLGDPRALPHLRKHYTGQPCDHSRFLCQYELKKAIRLCEGGRNLTAWTWRRFVR
jgi:hypothetical protein